MYPVTRRRPAAPLQARPRLEALEDRCLLSGNVLQTNLVSDLAGVAAVQDPHLVNPWGISESSGSPFWIADNNAGVSTLYSVPGTNNTPISINPLVVSMPTPGNSLGATGAPDGTVFNIDGGATGGFKLSGVDKNGNPITDSAVFLFTTEDGTLVGWNPAVNPVGFDPAKAGTYAIIVTRGHGHDEEALYHLASSKAGYVGMIGSKRKIKLIYEDLLARGLAPAALERVHAPLGFNIGSQTVPEIAISIVGELIAYRNLGPAAAGAKL